MSVEQHRAVVLRQRRTWPTSRPTTVSASLSVPTARSRRKSMRRLVAATAVSERAAGGRHWWPLPPWQPDLSPIATSVRPSVRRRSANVIVMSGLSDCKTAVRTVGSSDFRSCLNAINWATDSDTPTACRASTHHPLTNRLAAIWRLPH